MFKKIDRHDRQMAEMLERNGLHVAEAVDSGEISPSLYRGCLMRCACCDELEKCEAFLKENEGRDAEPPEYCRNKAEIARLKKIRA